MKNKKIGPFKLEVWWMASVLIVPIVGLLIAFILPGISQNITFEVLQKILHFFEIFLIIALIIAIIILSFLFFNKIKEK